MNEIAITQELLDRVSISDAQSFDKCAVAVALREKGYMHAVVTYQERYDTYKIHVMDKAFEAERYTCSAELKDWLDDAYDSWDTGVKVLPINIKLDREKKMASILKQEINMSKEVDETRKVVGIIPKKLFDTYQPNTVQGAVDELIKYKLTKDQKSMLKKIRKDDLIKLHSSLGRFIRNNFFMWEGNTKLIEDTGEEHPDDASGVIMEVLWDTLNK